MKQEDNVTLDGFNIQFGSFGLVEEDEDALQQEQDHHAVSKLEDSKPPSPPWRGLFTQPNSSRTAIDEEQRKDAECPSSLRPSLASHQIPLPNNNSVLSGEGRPASDVIHCQANEEKNDSLDELIRDALIKLHIHPSYETTAQLSTTPLRPRGMVNTGNSCFRSSVLQALLTCDAFTTPIRLASPLLTLEEVKKVLPWWAQFAQFIQEFEEPLPGDHFGFGRNDGGMAAVTPENSLGSILMSFRSEGGGEQEDADEFLMFFLEELHKDQVNASEEFVQERPMNNSSEGGWEEVTKGGKLSKVNRIALCEPGKGMEGNYSSLVSEVFGGQLRSEIRNRARNNLSVVLEPFRSLQLSLEKDDKELSTVEEAIYGYFTEDESLDGQEKSNRGGSGGQTVHKGGGTLGRTRTIKLESAPLVLILHLKQFYFDSVHGPRKRGLRIKYEDELEVPAFFLSSKATTMCKGTALRVLGYDLMMTVKRDSAAISSHQHLKDLDIMPFSA